MTLPLVKFPEALEVMRSQGKRAEDQSLWVGLLEHWYAPLGETGASVKDMGGNGGDGTFVNPVWTKTQRGTALDFQTNRVVQGSTRLAGFPRTMAAWVYVRTHTNFLRIFAVACSVGESTSIALGQESGAIRVSGEDTEQNERVFSLNTWQHIVGVFTDADTVSVYVNGAVAATTANTGNLIQGNVPNGGYSIGARWDESFSDSLVLQAGIWQRAMSISEVQMLFSDQASLTRLDRSSEGANALERIKRTNDSTMMNKQFLLKP